MGLLDLPLELFQQILEGSIQPSCSQLNLLQLSLVNSVFERELFALLQREKFLQGPDSRSVRHWPWTDQYVDFLAKYVSRRPYALGTEPAAHFPALVNWIVDKIDEDDCHCHKYERRRMRSLRTLCFWATRHAKKNILTGEYKSQTSPMDHVFVAATYLKKFTVIHNILNCEETSFPDIHSDIWHRPLRAAIYTESPSLVRLLLLSGAKPHPKGPDNSPTDLDFAVRTTAAKHIVPIFFEPRLKLFLPGTHIQRAILLAIQMRKVEVANILLNVFEDKTAIYPHPDQYFDGSLAKALNLACERGMVQLVTRLLEVRKTQNSMTVAEYTELAFIACAHGQEAVLRLLLDEGATFVCTTFEHYSIQTAAMGGHVNMVRFLLDAGETLSAVQATKVLRELAPRPKSSEVAWYLLQRGVIQMGSLEAGFKVTGTHLAHIMTSAAQRGNADFIEAAARFGAPIDDEDFYTNQDCPLPIIAAKAFGQMGVVQALIDLGARDRDPLDSPVTRYFKSGLYLWTRPLLKTFDPSAHPSLLKNTKMYLDNA